MSMNLLYSFREGVRELKRARLATFLTVSIVTITLILLGILMVVTLNVAGLVRRFQEKMTFEVFIEAGLSSTDVQLLQGRIQGIDGIQSVTFVSKEEALDRYRRQLDMDPMTILQENPLPASFEVSLQPEKRSARGAMDVIEKVGELEWVDDVVYHGRLYELLDKASRYVLAADGALFLIVLLAVIFLVSNTLRLTILSHRKTIQIMELVGATRGFIRRPFLIQGMLQGGIGGGVAALVIWILLRLFSTRFPNAIQLSLPVILFPLFLGLVLSYLGSRIGLKRFLRGT